MGSKQKFSKQKGIEPSQNWGQTGYRHGQTDPSKQKKGKSNWSETEPVYGYQNQNPNYVEQFAPRRQMQQPRYGNQYGGYGGYHGGYGGYQGGYGGYQGGYGGTPTMNMMRGQGGAFPGRVPASWNPPPAPPVEKRESSMGAGLPGGMEMDLMQRMYEKTGYIPSGGFGEYFQPDQLQAADIGWGATPTHAKRRGWKDQKNPYQFTGWEKGSGTGYDIPIGWNTWEPTPTFSATTSIPFVGARMARRGKAAPVTRAGLTSGISTPGYTTYSNPVGNWGDFGGGNFGNQGLRGSLSFGNQGPRNGGIHGFRNGGIASLRGYTMIGRR